MDGADPGPEVAVEAAEGEAAAVDAGAEVEDGADPRGRRRSLLLLKSWMLLWMIIG